MKGLLNQINPDVLSAKGDIPYWVIAQKLDVHENTLRNWLKKKMTPRKTAEVLAAIDSIKQDMMQVQ